MGRQWWLFPALMFDAHILPKDSIYMLGFSRDKQLGINSYILQAFHLPFHVVHCQKANQTQLRWETKECKWSRTKYITFHIVMKSWRICILDLQSIGISWCDPQSMRDGERCLTGFTLPTHAWVRKWISDTKLITCTKGWDAQLTTSCISFPVT